MRKLLLLGLGLGALALHRASGDYQPPVIQWQQNYGGGLNDILYSAHQCPDGGYILGGRSTSPPSSTKTAPHRGNYDYWVLRTDSSGRVLWDRSFGGSNWDELYQALPTPDGGFLLAGLTDSINNGNKTSPSHGSRDGWLIKLDANGNKLWEKTLGGTSSDVIWTAQITQNGNILTGGYSLSPPSGSKTSQHYGGDDYWVVRLDQDGQVLWDRTYGGLADDRLYALRETSDGGLILGGYSASDTNVVKTCPGYGSLDFWVIRTDAQGNKLWDRCYGGGSNDELYGLIQTSDGGFLFGGYSLSGPSGNKTSPAYGGYDLWIVRTDTLGNKLWDDSFGGYGAEGFLGVFGIAETPDGGYMFGSANQGFTAGGNKTSIDRGGGDWWVVRLTKAGVKLWDYSYGSEGFEALYSLEPTSDGGYVMGGSSYSGASGNKTAPSNGGADYWLVKLGPDVPQLRLLPRNGAVHFLLMGESNRLYVTECSSNLLDWTAIQTNQLQSSTMEITLPSSPGQQTFYRERLAPEPP